MRILYAMLIKSFIPILILAVLFFILILELVDLFSNLWRFLNYEIPVIEILRVAFLYIPKCISFSVPIALLFSVAFTLGNYYSNNELIAVFGSGISLYRFILPLLCMGLLLSLFLFFFEENVVLETFKKKNELSRELLKQRNSYSNTNVTVLSRNNNIVYHADYYNDTDTSLSGVIIIGRQNNNDLQFRIDAEKALWEDDVWKFPSCRLFVRQEENSELIEEKMVNYSHERVNEPPKTFRKTVSHIEEMTIEEASDHIASLRKSGLPFRGALTEYYKRFSFALTPLVVALISSAIGGRFRKNILLMSLLLSLIISVVYYVIQMVLVILAKVGFLPPSAGAWGAFIIFLFVSFGLFKTART